MPKKPQTKQRRWRRRLAYVGLGFVFLLGLLYLFRVAIFGSWLAESIATAIGDACNAGVNIEQLDGSWVSDLRIKGLSLQAKSADQSLQAISLSELEITYSFWGL